MEHKAMKYSAFWEMENKWCTPYTCPDLLDGENSQAKAQSGGIQAQPREWPALMRESWQAKKTQVK